MEITHDPTLALNGCSYRIKLSFKDDCALLDLDEMRLSKETEDWLQAQGISYAFIELHLYLILWLKTERDAILFKMFFG